VYLDDLEATRTSPSKSIKSTTSSPAKKKKYVSRDQYALPELEGTIQSKAAPSDPRLATDAELRDFIEEMRPEDFDIDSEFFANLPTEIKYEIVGDLRIKSRQANYKRVEAMRAQPTALDFSKAQIKNLMERNGLTQKLLTVTDTIGKANLTIPVRIASERNKEYVLIKNDVSQGGGWVLGVRDPPKESSPLKIDATESEGESTSESDEFEEVGVPTASVSFFANNFLNSELIKGTQISLSESG
jgi:DNA excision repair protein ERCC-5